MTDSQANVSLTSRRIAGNAGTSVKNSFKDPTRLQQEEIVDDFDVDYSSARVPPHQVTNLIEPARQPSHSTRLFDRIPGTSGRSRRSLPTLRST